MAPKTKSKSKGKTKPSRGGTVVLFKDREKSPSARPVSVYCERIEDGSLKIWWHAENSQTVGKEPVTETDKLTKMQNTIGYRYTIPYTAEKAKEIIAKKGPNTKFYHKDGETTKSVTEDKF